MTVQANLPPTNTNSDGTTTTFNYGFKVTREEHLKAIYTVIATGESGDLEIDSVTGIGNDGGGTVTFATAPADGMIVTVDSIAPLSQIEAFTGNKLPPATVERMGDAIAIQNQRQQSQIERSVRFPASDDQIPTLPAKAQRADKILGFTADGSDFLMVEGAAASQAYVDLAEAQADRAVAAVTYPYTSAETKTGAFMPGSSETLTLFTYDSVSDAAVTLSALSGLASIYNIGICRTSGSGDLTISADDGALINGQNSITLASDYLCLDFTINSAGDEWVAVDKVVVGLPVGTGAGNFIVLDGSARLPAVDASQLLAVRDETARDTAIIAFIKADISANDPAGVYGAPISDNFIADTLAVKTNAQYDATDDYYYNASSAGQISQATGTNIGNMTGAGGVAASFDDNTNQSDGAGSQISAASGWGGKNWGATQQVSQVRVWRPNNAGIDGVAGSGTITVTVEGSATGAWGGEEVSLGSNTATDYDGARGGAGQSSDEAAGTYDYIQVSVTDTAYAYHRVVTSGAGSEVRIAEIQFFEPGTVLDMTLRPSATTLEDADPANITVYFRVEDIDSVTEETDRIVKVSIDNGSTWETCEITRVGAFGANDTLIKAEGNVSAQTGSTYLWELATANSKSQRIKQVVSLPSD